MFKIYGTTTCGYCKRATALLQERGYKYTYWPLDQEPEAMKILQEQYKWRTVPMIIWIPPDKDPKDNQEFIGGFTDLVEWINVNKK